MKKSRPEFSRFEVATQIFLVWGGIVALALVMFHLEDPVMRLRFGMLAFAPIIGPWVWLVKRFAATEMLGKDESPRRFTKLRGAVQELLREITRLNWAVMDAHRGFRDQDEADAECEHIKERMSEILERIKLLAGQARINRETQQQLKAIPRWSIEAPASRLP